MEDKYVLGLDFGTDSVRALVVNARTGTESGSGVAYYQRWLAGKYCLPEQNQFRQHPLDYLEGMEEAVKKALATCQDGLAPNIVGIGVDTTGSTPCAVDQAGIPLALLPQFTDNPNAMFVLWKDHTAVAEAAEINQKAQNWGGIDFTRYEGGVYSSEWFWSKILHILRNDPEIGRSAFSWVEHCDWIPALLTGKTNPLTMKRSRCAAGHKAMWHQDWGGLPTEDFLLGLDPLLAGLRERLYQETVTSDQPAGELTAEWANRLGLPVGITVAVGAFDAHMGAVGGGITENTLVKIMGTSTCDVMVVAPDKIKGKLIKGICGQVNGSVIPGLVGLEAGQSAFGDVYNWFKQLLSWPLEAILPELNGLGEADCQRIAEEVGQKILGRLTVEAKNIDSKESGLLALDWLNGRRSPFADQTLKGAILGLNLGTTAPRFFRALVEATAFGARAINQQFTSQGVEIKEVIALGGISQKNDFVMQITADVLNLPIKVAASTQTCALGAAMFAAVAAGQYSDLNSARDQMNSGFVKTYQPRPDYVEKYQGLYQAYQAVGKKLEEDLRKL